MTRQKRDDGQEKEIDESRRGDKRGKRRERCDEGWGLRVEGREVGVESREKMWIRRQARYVGMDEREGRGGMGEVRRQKRREDEEEMEDEKCRSMSET